MRFGFQRRRCAMFVVRRGKNLKLRKSGMSLAQEETCRSYGAIHFVFRDNYNHVAPTALNLSISRPSAQK
jgi:hypothetical protein